MLESGRVQAVLDVLSRGDRRGGSRGAWVLDCLGGHYHQAVEGKGERAGRGAKSICCLSQDLGYCWVWACLSPARRSSNRTRLECSRHNRFRFRNWNRRWISHLHNATTNSTASSQGREQIWLTGDNPLQLREQTTTDKWSRWVGVVLEAAQDGAHFLRRSFVRCLFGW